MRGFSPVSDCIAGALTPHVQFCFSLVGVGGGDSLTPFSWAGDGEGEGKKNKRHDLVRKRKRTSPIRCVNRCPSGAVGTRSRQVDPHSTHCKTEAGNSQRRRFPPRQIGLVRRASIRFVVDRRGRPSQQRRKKKRNPASMPPPHISASLPCAPVPDACLLHARALARPTPNAQRLPFSRRGLWCALWCAPAAGTRRRETRGSPEIFRGSTWERQRPDAPHPSRIPVQAQRRDWLAEADPCERDGSREDGGCIASGARISSPERTSFWVLT